MWGETKGLAGREEREREKEVVEPEPTIKILKYVAFFFSFSFLKERKLSYNQVCSQILPKLKYCHSSFEDQKCNLAFKKCNCLASTYKLNS